MDRDTGIVGIRWRFLNALTPAELSAYGEKQSWPAPRQHAKLLCCARFPGTFTVIR